jgi:hypothetical protein
MNAITPSAPRLADLPGLWQRSLIRWPDGRSDTTTVVHWLQGPSLYIDLRQPAGRPDFAGVREDADLDAARLGWLAMQEGFAGRLRHDDGWFEWGREIDLQPQAIYSDCGRLWYEDDRMVEEGRDIKYIEHWHARGEGAAQAAALRLAADDDGRAGFLVRAGDLFMFARDRALALPALASLAECVAAAPDHATARALVDCEISFGRVRPEGFAIVHSSLPWRERTLLAPCIAGDALVLRDPRAGTATGWRILDAEGELALLGG